jgi:hypothetical protein
MFFYFQAALVVVGAVILVRGLRFGRQEVSSPIASLVGLLLVGQLPACLWLSFVFDLSDIFTAGEMMTAGSWWVDPLVTGAAFLIAGALVVVGLRDPKGPEDDATADAEANVPSLLEPPEVQPINDAIALPRDALPERPDRLGTFRPAREPTDPPIPGT